MNTPNAGQHPAVVSLLEFFEYDHLPPDLAQVSMDCHELAHRMVVHLQHTSHGAELAAGLRKLLEAKDCFVRAGLAELPRVVS